MSTGVFAATVRTAHKTCASSILKREKNLLGANACPAFCSQLCLAGMLTTSASPSPTILHFCISPKEHHSLATGTSCHSLQPGFFPNLTALPAAQRRNNHGCSDRSGLWKMLFKIPLLKSTELLASAKSFKLPPKDTQIYEGSNSLPRQIDRTQILGPTVLMLLGQTPSAQCGASPQFLQAKARGGSTIFFTDTTSLPARV